MNIYVKLLTCSLISVPIFTLTCLMISRYFFVNFLISVCLYEEVILLSKDEQESNEKVLDISIGFVTVSNNLIDQTSDAADQIDWSDRIDSTENIDWTDSTEWEELVDRADPIDRIATDRRSSEVLHDTNSDINNVSIVTNGNLVNISEYDVVNSNISPRSKGVFYQNMIFDYNSDPNEINNLFYNISQYSYINIDYMEQRRQYWMNLTLPDTSPSTSLKNSAFGKCGHVCPWLSSNFTPRTTEQSFINENSPNIVFVLIDDWGYNDFGKKSTYMGWATPTIDRLADEGILLNNYYTNEVCAPSRASFITGKYSLRLGMFSNTAELPLSEYTLAEELKSAGYRTYIIGKWHLGLSTVNHWPNQRGFDYFYGFVIGDNHYWSKKYGRHLDLFENNEVVTNIQETDPTLHAAYLYQTKAEKVIQNHAENYSDKPMFLYYSLQLVHAPWTAPLKYIQRCVENGDGAYDQNDDDVDRSSQDFIENYCAMNVMMDEAIANLTCALNKFGLSDNTIMIISGDNGGEAHMVGSSYPFRGSKGSLFRGGVSNHAIIHSSLIPSERRGGSYDYDVHITGKQQTCSSCYHHLHGFVVF